jgi:hypothetical protein
MRTERRVRIAWKAYLAELGVRQMLERPSDAEISERFRRYFRWRLEEAIGVLSDDSSALSEVLIELFLTVTGEDEIVGWRPPAVEETLSRITEPLTSSL